MLKEHVQLLIVTGMMYMHYTIITTSPSSSYVKNKFSKRSIKARVPLYQFSYGMPCLGFGSYNPLYLDCIIFRRTRRVVPLTYQATFLSEKQEILFPFLFLFLFCWFEYRCNNFHCIKCAYLSLMRLPLDDFDNLFIYFPR